MGDQIPDAPAIVDILIRRPFVGIDCRHHVRPCLVHDPEQLTPV